MTRCVLICIGKFNLRKKAKQARFFFQIHARKYMTFSLKENTTRYRLKCRVSSFNTIPKHKSIKLPLFNQTYCVFTLSLQL